MVFANDLHSFCEQEKLVVEGKQTAAIFSVGVDTVFVDKSYAHPFKQEVVAQVFGKGAAEYFLNYPDRVSGCEFDEARGFGECGMGFCP